MGFWNKLGKIALQAAPYIAAPFTGGASLAATGLTQQLGNKWAQSDANKAAQKGLGPSKFDSALGTVSGLAGTASGLGAFGKLGGSKGGIGGVKGDVSSVSNRVSQLGNQGGAGGFLGGLKNAIGGGGGNSGWSGILGGLLGGQGGQGPGNLGNRNGLPPWAMNLSGGGQVNGPSGPGYSGSSSRPPMNSGGIAPSVPGMDRFYQQAGRQLGPVMGNMNQNNPNLAESIGAGRMEAIQNQPFRGGYDIYTEGPEPANDAEVAQPIVSRMPPIGPTGGNYMRDMNRNRGRGRQMSMAR